VNIQIGGLTIATRTKAAVEPMTYSGGWTRILEAFTGAWQRNIEVDRKDVLTYGTVWACVTLIASDISKLWLNLVEKDKDGICTPTESSAFSPVLRKPNHYQTRLKFFESWVISKLTTGNTYVLKERDNRYQVVAMYVLDPARVKVLVAPNGEVYYQLGEDYLAGLGQAATVPSSEIIHDVGVPLYHPLCGISPIHACGLAATQGLKIQHNSATLFGSGSQLSGVLSAPQHIPNETATRIEQHWQDNFAGEQNIGKVAVLGNGLTFEPMTMTAVDAQLIDQLKWTSENVCACFHVPGYMVGIGPPPPYTDIQSINLQYYTQALQNPIENIEILIEEGLELPRQYGIEFDLDALARMDTKTQIENATKGIIGGLYKPNEARADLNLKPVEGGDSVYMQNQQYSLAALARRDSASPAPPTSGPTPPALPAAKELTRSQRKALVLGKTVLAMQQLADAA
jgi:HK97 family phage portal protein